MSRKSRDAEINALFTSFPLCSPFLGGETHSDRSGVENEEFNRNLKPISLVPEHSLGPSRSRVTIMEQGFPPQDDF